MTMAEAVQRLRDAVNRWQRALDAEWTRRRIRYLYDNYEMETANNIAARERLGVNRVAKRPLESDDAPPPPRKRQLRQQQESAPARLVAAVRAKTEERLAAATNPASGVFTFTITKSGKNRMMGMRSNE